MANNLDADIWLGYGSFAYGFESKLLEIRASQLVLETKTQSNGVNSNSTDSNTSSKQLFELIESKSKALLLTEIRIYFTESQIRNYQLPGCTLHLTSVFAPESLPSRSDGLGNSARFQVSEVRPLRPADTMLWHLLNQRIWPEL